MPPAQNRHFPPRIREVGLNGSEGNSEALKEVLNFIRLKDSTNQKVIR